MVLAAGFGSRMMPLTAEVSKVVFPLAGRQVIIRALDFLVSRAAVKNIVVNLHHAPNSVKDCLENYPQDIEYSFEKEILGTGGALYKMKDSFVAADDTFIMVNGDSFFGDCPIDRALEFHRAKGALATMVVMDMPVGDKYGAVEVDSEFRVRRIAGMPADLEEKYLKPCHFVGMHIMEPDILSLLPAGASDINRDVYPSLIEMGAPVYAFHTSFTWFDLGTPQRFLNAFEVLAGTESEDSLIINDHSTVSAKMEFAPPLEICSGAEIGCNCAVGRSIIMKNAVVGDNCRIENSIVGQDTVISPGSELRNAMVANVGGKLEISHWLGYRS